MDTSTFLTSLLSSGVLSIGAAQWLTKRFIDHRFKKELAEHKGTIDAKVGKELADYNATLNDRLATAKAELEASLHKNVEEYLGEKTAERQYRFEAQKRLYAAVGPLRFQLVIACNDFAGRIERIGRGEERYAISLGGYFGRSTTFRLLRPFALSELIERQVAYADFSVDPSTVSLLGFKKAAFRCMVSGDILLGHPKANWHQQVEHVYGDILSSIAGLMIVNDGIGTPNRPMRFDEFDKFVEAPENIKAMHPIPRLMEAFSPVAKPVLWIRFVTLASLCMSFVQQEGPPVGIPADPFDAAAILRSSQDTFVENNYDSFREMLQSMADTWRVPVLKARKASASADSAV